MVASPPWSGFFSTLPACPHSNTFLKASLRLTSSRKSFLNTATLMAFPDHASLTFGSSRLALSKNTQAPGSHYSRPRGLFPTAKVLLSEGGNAGVP